MPDTSLHHLDFSQQVKVSRARVDNFPTGPMTVSFWILWRPGPGNSRGARLISYCDILDPGEQRGPRFLVVDPSNITIWLAGSSISTGIGVGDGNWHHVAIAMEPIDAGSQITGFRDGERRFRGLLARDSGLSLQSGGPFMIAFPFDDGSGRDDEGSSGGQSGSLQGLGGMAEIRVWEGARTGLQIAVEMTGYLKRDPMQKLYWPLAFSNASANLATDASGNSNDGQIRSVAPPQLIYDPLPWRAAPLDLSGVGLNGSDISGLPLPGRKLLGAALAGADLSGSDLTGTNLSDANLQGAKVSGTNLRNAIFHGTNLSSTDLTVATLGSPPDWSHDPVHPTNLEKATVTTGILGRDWSWLRLSGAKITDLDSKTDLSHLHAANVVFQDAPLEQCTLSKANFDGADLTRALLNFTNLTGASLRGATLYTADMSHVTLTGADLTNAKLGGAGDSNLSAVLSFAYMPGVILTNAEMYGVSLTKAQIYAGARMDGAHLEDADLNDAILSDVDFTQAHMKSANLSGAVLVGANFRNVDLSPSGSGKSTNLAGAHLEGADFTSAKLYGADLSNARVALKEGTLKVQRLDENGALVDVAVAYKPTAITAEVADTRTVWPNSSRGPLTDPERQLNAQDPPKPAACIPSLTNWCPQAKAKATS